MKIAIIVFCFRRVDLLKNLLLKLQSQSRDIPVFLYVDGPLEVNDILIRNEIEKLILNTKLNIILRKRKFNLGLGNNITEGISEVLETYEYVIYLEDDLLIADDLINFYLESINYIKNKTYDFVTGYKELNINGNYWFYGSECLSLIISKSNWKNFTNDSEYLLAILKSNFINNFRKISLKRYKNLIHQILYKPNLWANNFHIYCCLNNLKTFVPEVSKISHLGNDIYATNYKSIHDFSKVNIINKKINFLESKRYIENEKFHTKLIGFVYYTTKYIIKRKQIKIKNYLNNYFIKKLWKNNNGENLRIPKNLKDKSVIFELGFHDGSFVHDVYKFNSNNIIINAYEPNACYFNNFKLEKKGLNKYNYALSDFEGNGILSNEDAGSSIVYKNGIGSLIYVKDIYSEISNYDQINVLNMNIEGSEYDCILHLYNKNFLRKIKIIYVQFHLKNKNKDINKLILIKNLLKETHRIEWHYENYWTKYILN